MTHGNLTLYTPYHMTELHAQRLMTLARFLWTLPEKKFNFHVIVSGKDKLLRVGVDRYKDLSVSINTLVAAASEEYKKENESLTP